MEHFFWISTTVHLNGMLEQQGSAQAFLDHGSCREECGSSHTNTSLFVDEVVTMVDAELLIVLVLLVLNQIVRPPTVQYVGRSRGDAAIDDL
ncbi:hypothetical protein KIN20_002114 [Parelaphostrongylus tenuis]|uniref:Uncharacterized protein n=1 Tax=Parelaphostrongylus tenuis TaxID=148309 RepID=A0AAD5QF34_PARTN|nr:hypothetical protein KIN20_002114 [Parelaphostrongylus tenuis]